MTLRLPLYEHRCSVAELPDFHLNSPGDCVFATNNADYGEWIEVGDAHEWLSEEEVSLKVEQNNFYFGLPPGTVVYIREKKLWKSRPGVPMVVSYRSAVVGNEKPDKTSDKNYFGQILAFVGQTEVNVSGPVESGDFIVASGELHCEAISPSNITFQQYMDAVGRAIESNSDVSVKRVWCAINY